MRAGAAVQGLLFICSGGRAERWGRKKSGGKPSRVQAVRPACNRCMPCAALSVLPCMSAGRRDAEGPDPDERMPPLDASAERQLLIFAASGLNAREFMALCGGHTVCVGGRRQGASMAGWAQGCFLRHGAPLSPKAGSAVGAGLGGRSAGGRGHSALLCTLGRTFRWRSGVQRAAPSPARQPTPSPLSKANNEPAPPAPAPAPFLPLHCRPCRSWAARGMATR